jgi:hypothetical protein
MEQAKIGYITVVLFRRTLGAPGEGEQIGQTPLTQHAVIQHRSVFEGFNYGFWVDSYQPYICEGH